MERLILRPEAPRPAGVPAVIRCGVNPEEMLLQRDAGYGGRTPAAIGKDPQATRAGGVISGPGLPGRDVAFTGAGRTLLTLNLLFDDEWSALRGPERVLSIDVRTLTEPLFRLAAPAQGRGDRPCPVDLIWGKHWSFRGVVARVSERMDRFTADGMATRSWVKIEFESTPPARGLRAFADDMARPTTEDAGR